MGNMAIFKATYTKSSGGAKASIRNIEHRPGKDNTKITRTLWGWDGKMERKEAYAMIDEARRGSYFFRFVISPDPVKEDTHKDIYLRDLTEQTMLGLEERLQRPIHFVAATHDDHAPHRHVHLVAIVPKKLQVQDLQAVREMATEAALDQRRQRDNIVEQSREKGKEQAWQRERERSK